METAIWFLVSLMAAHVVSGLGSLVVLSAMAESAARSADELTMLRKQAERPREDK